MATAATVQPAPSEIRPRRRLFDVDEYHLMVSSGILTKQDRVELIEGEVVKMPPIGNRHATSVRRLIAFFSGRLGSHGLLDVQNPVVLSQRSEPQPDVTILRPREDYYEQRAPEPQDVLLLVEVADTSLPYDREIKLPLYARSGIAEVWVVDLAGQLIEVLRQPGRNGYRERLLFKRGQTLSPSAFPDLKLSVGQILGSASSP